MTKRLESAAKSLGRALSFHSTRSQTSSRAPSRADSKMEVDTPSPVVHESSSQGEPPRYILTNDSQITLLTRIEKGVFNSIKDNEFFHTLVFDNALLVATGMDTEFELVFRIMGWENACAITEEGSKLLTIEFLSTLELGSDEVSFRLLNQEFTVTWKNLSTMLGFSSGCPLDIDDILRDFDRTQVESIFEKRFCHKPTTEEIHHPTLRFMHKWLAITFFPREELGTVRIEELKLLYAMIKKRSVSPVKYMLKFWTHVSAMKKCGVTFTP